MHALKPQAAIPGPQIRGCGVLFFCLMLLAGSLWGASLGVFVWFLEDAKPTIAALEGFRPKVGTKVYSAPTADSPGQLLGEYSEETRRVVPLGEIPLHLQKAFIATEDDIFYTHKGVRPDAIFKALIYTLQTGRTRGGSTVTQQVVRNVEPLLVGQERTLKRKLREAIVALQVEREFTKDEILELYLNQIFLGISAYGVEAAARQYFGKGCADLSLGQAATLAGLTRSPNRNEPRNHFDNAIARRDIVLKQMANNNFISPEEYEAAIAEDLAESIISVEALAALRVQGQGIWGTNKFQAPYFAEEVRQFAYNNYEKDEVLGEGLEIHTTVDMRLQQAAEEILDTALKAFDEMKRKELTDEGRLDEFIPVWGALACIDNRPAYRGFVRALVGGRDFNTQKFNNATQAWRQPGSSVKPFVWSAAIDNGLTPSTVIIDEPFERIDGTGELWQPKNFEDLFLGPITIRHALEKSVNIVSIKLVEQLGVPLVRSYFEACGVPADMSDLSLALGVKEVTVLELCAAYATFANGGVHHNPILITEITDRDGLIRYNYHDYARKRNALKPKVAYVVTHMLQGVCTTDPTLRTEQYPAGYYPSGWRTERLGRPHAGKTGTTNNSTNVWFSGFTPDYTCVVWLGYQDNRPLGKGLAYTGGGLASPIWTDFMIAAHGNLPVRDFDVPPYGVTFNNIDRLKGVMGGSYREAYITGTAPPTEWYGDLYEDLETLDERLLEEL